MTSRHLLASGRRDQRTPRLSIGLPVYNGERYLASSLDSLLSQTFGDFELIISDNASTDGTADICRDYAARDGRISYFRHSVNGGLASNHTFCFDRAIGELFKWVSHDDLYRPELLEHCVKELDAHPEAVLAHSWTTTIDELDKITSAPVYPLSTSSPSAPERFHSLLFDSGGDDIYGIVRSDVLRRALPHRSHHHADRTLVAELSLYGPFLQVPDWLYSRRYHPDQSGRSNQGVRARCVILDPRRANPLWHPILRLYGEYVWSYFTAIHRAPLTSKERLECYRHVARWVASRRHRDCSHEDRVTQSPSSTGGASEAIGHLGWGTR